MRVISKTYLKSLLSILFIGLSYFLSVCKVEAQSTQSIYKEGIVQKTQNNPIKALKSWYSAKKTLNEPDFRIAQACISLATQKDLNQYYQKASELYYWGLSGSISTDEQEALVKELNFIKPLIKYSVYRNLKKKIQHSDSTALGKLRQFWKKLDPTPLSPYNERLIEHWQRISFAQKNYSQTNSEKLDARGLTYVRYGTPQFKKSGILSYKSGLVHRLLLEGIQTPSFGNANDIAAARAQRFNLETRVRQLHNYPNYEIWIYRNLTDNSQSTIFLFGSEGGPNNFRRIKSVDDFIPNGAYKNVGQNNYSITISDKKRDQTNSNVQFDAARRAQNIVKRIRITPALILQIMYYEQFAALDDYFGKSYNEMMDRFIDNANSPSSTFTGLEREFATIYGSKLQQIQSKAPKEKSKDKSNILSIPTKNYGYRYLDDENHPYLKIYSIIDIKKALYYDLLKNTNSLQSNINNRYALVSGYILKDEVNSQIRKRTKRVQIYSSNKTVVTFDILYQNQPQSATISHELHNIKDEDSTTISDNTPYPTSLKGLNNDTINLPNPLSTDKLIMSDLLLGYSDSTTEAKFSNNLTNIIIAHDKVIPKGKNLNLYYELYNLQPNDSSGISKFTFHYSIKKKHKGLGLFRKSPDNQISITINNSVADDSYQKLLSIKTPTLDAGNYELNIQIRDLNSEAEYSKTLGFEVQ